MVKSIIKKCIPKTLLSKRAGTLEDILPVLEKYYHKKVAPLGGRVSVSGLDVNKAWRLLTHLESAGKFAVGDAGTSFGLTQVQIGRFLDNVSKDPRITSATGMRPQELQNLADAWRAGVKKLKDVDFWKTVPVDKNAVRQSAQEKGNVVRRMEGITIKHFPQGIPGVVKVKGGRFIGRALDLGALRRAGLDTTDPFVMNKVKKIMDQYITDRVVRNALARILAYQRLPQTHERFMRTFSAKNVNRNSVLQSISNNVSKQDFMNRAREVSNMIQQYGYDTSKPGAFNPYQLLIIANASGLGVVRRFLKSKGKRPFASGHLTYLRRANPIIEKMTGVSSNMPSQGGIGGFSRFGSATLKVPLPSGMSSNELAVVFTETLEKLNFEFLKDKELKKRVWKEYEEEEGRDISQKEFEEKNKLNIISYLVDNWSIIPLSKRASYDDALYFPQQYAEDIKNGKRRITIRGQDIPFNSNDVVKCKTYSGSHICDLRIINKEWMSPVRIRKYFGEYIADGLENRFGPNQFLVVRFDVEQNVEDDYGNNNYGNIHGTDSGETGAVRPQYYQTVAPTNAPYNECNDISVRAMPKILVLVKQGFDDVLYFKPIETLKKYANITVGSQNNFVKSKNGKIISAGKYDIGDFDAVYVAGNNKIKCDIPLAYVEKNNLPFEKAEKVIRANDGNVAAELLIGEIKKPVKKIATSKTLLKLWKIADEWEEDPNLQRIKFENPEEYERLKREELLESIPEQEEDPAAKWLREQEEKAKPAPTPAPAPKPKPIPAPAPKKPKSTSFKDLVVEEPESDLFDEIFDEESAPEIEDLEIEKEELDRLLEGIELPEEEQEPEEKQPKEPKKEEPKKEEPEPEEKPEEEVVKKPGLEVGEKTPDNIEEIFEQERIEKANKEIRKIDWNIKAISNLINHLPSKTKLYTYKVDVDAASKYFGEVGMGALNEESSRKAEEMANILRGQELLEREEITLQNLEDMREQLEKKKNELTESINKKIVQTPSLESDEEVQKLNEQVAEDTKLDKNNQNKIDEKIKKNRETDNEMTELLSLKNRQTIFGFRFEAPEDWPKKIEKPKMSEEAESLFSLENLADSYSMNMIFQNPDVWNILGKEENKDKILKNWLFPAIVNNIAKKWFMSNAKGNVGRTPFSMFSSEEEEIIRRKVEGLREDEFRLMKQIEVGRDVGKDTSKLEEQLATIRYKIDNISLEDIDQAKVWKKYVLYYTADITNTYFSKKRDSSLIGGYIWEGIKHSMTKKIAEYNGYKESRAPVCAICIAESGKYGKSALDPMEKDGRFWTCPNCMRKAEELENKDLHSAQKQLDDINKKITSVQGDINRTAINIKEGTGKSEEYINKLKIRLVQLDKQKKEYLINKELLNKDIDEVNNKIRRYSNQRRIPTLHVYCINVDGGGKGGAPNEPCPGKRVPLNSIDWENKDFWSGEEGQSSLKYLKRHYDIVPPWEQQASDKKRGRWRGEYKQLLNVPFICPHDGARFTLEETWKQNGAKYNGEKVVEPYYKSFWRHSSQLTRAEEGALQETETYQDTDQKIVYEQYADLARRIFLLKYDDFLKRVSDRFNEMTKKMPLDKVKASTSYKRTVQTASLYKTIKDFSTGDPQEYIAWLAGHSFTENVAKDGMIIKKVRKMKTSYKKDRNLIYQPLLRQWFENMLAPKNGFEDYGLKDFLTNEETDGVPSSSSGTFFITKVYNDKTGFGAKSNLTLKLTSQGTPLRSNSSKKPRILKLMNIWKLNSNEVKSIPGQLLNGKVAVPEKFVINIIRNKETRIGEVDEYTYSNISLNKEVSDLEGGDYLLVQAYMMPGQYNFLPFKLLQEIKKDNGGQQFFEKFGRLALGNQDDPEFWTKVKNLSTELITTDKSPEEILKELGDKL